MDVDNEQVTELAKKWLNGEASAAEAAQLHAWFDTINAGETENVIIVEEKTNAQYGQDMLAELQQMITADKKDVEPEEKNSVRRFNWTRFAAAAVIIIALGTGTYFYFKPSTEKPTQIVSKATDVSAPAINRATITLSNGQKVFLDSVGNGTLAQQGTVAITKLQDGKISYSAASPGPSNGGEKEMIYNVLSNPRGSKVIDMTLSDGSRVWLNAESSLKYPVAFGDNNRVVEISGEAYFEVVHNAAKPFVVTRNDVMVTVLGTHFNVNAYEDEKAMKVTLLEGSVKVASPGPSNRGEKERPSIVIKPGEQVIIDQTMKLVRDADTDEVMAWKNGKFKFDNADIQQILRQVGRWYDLDVSYEHAIPDGHYHGTIPRESNAKKMLQIIENSGVKFRIEGKKLIIE